MWERVNQLFMKDHWTCRNLMIPSTSPPMIPLSHNHHIRRLALQKTMLLTCIVLTIVHYISRMLTFSATDSRYLSTPTPSGRTWLKVAVKIVSTHPSCLSSGPVTLPVTTFSLPPKPLLVASLPHLHGNPREPSASSQGPTLSMRHLHSQPTPNLHLPKIQLFHRLPHHLQSTLPKNGLSTSRMHHGLLILTVCAPRHLVSQSRRRLLEAIRLR